MIRLYLKFLYQDVTSGNNTYMLKLLEQDKESVMLDCGCWDGKNTLTYSRKIGTNKIYGIELDKEKADIARNKKINVKISDLNSKLPFPDNFFDVIVANHVIEHLSDPASFVSELKRLLKKDGYAIIATPNLASWHNIFSLLLGFQPPSGPHVSTDKNDIGVLKKIHDERKKKIFKKESTHLRHIVVMTYKTLIKLFKSKGFLVEKTYGFGYYPLPPPFSRLFQNIDKSHSHYVILKVRKR